MTTIATNTGIAYDRVYRSGPLSDVESRWIGRCKRCGATHKVEGQLMLAARASGSSSDYVVKTGAGSLYTTSDMGSNPTSVTVACGDHRCTLHRVHEGTKKSKHECGARCTSATGPNCDCRCKGQNHGINC